MLYAGEGERFDLKDAVASQEHEAYDASDQGRERMEGARQDRWYLHPNMLSIQAPADQLDTEMEGAWPCLIFPTATSRVCGEQACRTDDTYAGELTGTPGPDQLYMLIVLEMYADASVQPDNADRCFV